MTIEAWDASTGRWVFYRSVVEHGADCLKHPFESIPRRVFLDTNVINLLVKYAGQVFEQSPMPKDMDETRAQDVEALMHVFYVGARAMWGLVASRKTLEEVRRTPDPEGRERLLDYAVELIAALDDDGVLPETSRSTSLLVLPDPSDRLLVANAISNGCDAFCTCDRRTIIKHRDKLLDVPIRILTPLEWWRCVRPWGGLFA